MIVILIFIYSCKIHPACTNSGIAREISISASSQTINPILWSVDWSADGQFFAVGGTDRLLRIYEAKRFKLLQTYKLPSVIQCLDWNRNGKTLAIASDDYPTQLLHVETGKLTRLQNSNASRALAWSNDGKLLAIGDAEGLLQIWSSAGKLIKSITKDNTKSYLSVDWHPTKNTILTGSDKIRLFDTSGNLLKTIKHRKEETIILSVNWHPGGNFFAVGDYGHKEENIESLLQFWNENGTLIKSLRGSKAEYRNIRWNKSGELLATASDALRLWTKDGKIAYIGNTRDLLWGIDWDKQSKNLVTTSNTGKITIWTNEAKLVKAIL